MGQGIPPCVKELLNESGYDNIISIEEMNETKLIEVEQYIERKLRENVNKLCCCSSEFYRENRPFEFLPGHKILIHFLSKTLRESHHENANENASKNASENVSNQDLDESREEYSTLLEELIRSSKYNSKQIPTQHRYTEVLKCVSTYIFMLAGKKCYELLCTNLPIPKTPSISEFLINIDSFF